MLSVCIFGSRARQTADLLSDHDILVVGFASILRDEIVAEWKAKSWQVTIFDRPAFSRLAEVRSLFIQHLKQEGHLLRDDGDFLTSMFSRYSPKLSYAAERNDALKQITKLPSVGGSDWFNMCLADISYVLLRNALILHFASKGVYHFQYDILIDEAGKDFNLTERDRLVLLKLRDLKHGYRKRFLDDLVKPCLKEVRRIVGYMINTIPNTIVSSIANGNTTEDYYQLRLEELKLVYKFDPRKLDLLSRGKLFETWQRILGAGGYPKDKLRLH